MEEIEYLEEYEDLILPMSFAVDDGKCNEGLDGRKSIDSLEMLYKDLIEETSLPQNQADISPFSLNPQMVSPEKTILSSSTDIGLTQSLPNYSLNTTPPAYVSTTNTDSPYQAQTSNVQYLNRLANKGFSTYSSLQKPDKLKSVATVKPTLQRTSNPPKQYVQKELPIMKTGQSVAPVQHNSRKSTGTKTTLSLKKSSKISKNKGSKFPNSGVDPLAGLNDDELMDFDEKNDLVNSFDFESDLENSIIAGLSDMESVDLSDDFIDDNFDLESDLSLEGSDLKKSLKRKRSNLSSQDSSERQTNASNFVKKKIGFGNKSTSEANHIPKSLTKDVATKDVSVIAHSTKVSEILDNGNNSLPQISGKLNEHEHAHVSNVFDLTPTVPLNNKPSDKTGTAIKQLISTLSNGKCGSQIKDGESYAAVSESQIGHEFKNNLIDQKSLKSPQRSSEAPPKLGSLYLRSIKPPTKNATVNKVPTNQSHQTEPCKKSASHQTKTVEEGPATSQRNISAVSAPKDTITNYLIAHSLAENVSKKLNSTTPTSEKTRHREKRKSVPRISALIDHESLPNVGEKDMPKLKRHKSLGAITVKETTACTNKNAIDNFKQQNILSRTQKMLSKLSEGSPRKEVNLVRPLESKLKDSRPKVQSLSSISVSTPKMPEIKKDDLSEQLKVQSQIKQPALKVLEIRKDDSSEKSKVQSQVKQSPHKTSDVIKEISSENPKVQHQEKQTSSMKLGTRKEISSENAKLQTQVRYPTQKAQEARKESEKSKVQTEVKQSAHKGPEARSDVSSENPKVQPQVKQTSSAKPEARKEVSTDKPKGHTEVKHTTNKAQGERKEASSEMFKMHSQVKQSKVQEAKKEDSSQKHKLQSEPKQSIPKSQETKRDNGNEKPKVQSQVKQAVSKASEVINDDITEKPKVQSLAKHSVPGASEERKDKLTENSKVQSHTKLSASKRVNDTSDKPKMQSQVNQPANTEGRRSESLVKSKMQSHVKQFPVKTIEGCTDDTSSKSKMQHKMKHNKDKYEEQTVTQLEKVSFIKTKTSKDHRSNNEISTTSKGKISCAGEQTAMTPEKSAVQNGIETKNDSSELKAKLKRSKKAVEESKKRVGDKKASAVAADETGEKDGKQLKAMEKQNIAEDKRLDCNELKTTTSQNAKEHNNIPSTSITKKPPQQDKIQSLPEAEEKPSPPVQDTPPTAKRRRKRFRHLRATETLNLRSAPDPSTIHPERIIVEKPLPQDEHENSVLPPTTEKATQKLEKDLTPKLQTNVTAHSTASSLSNKNLSTTSSSQREVKKLSKAGFRNLSRRMQQSMSQSKTVSLEQKRLKLRHFKVRLDRKIVDHFMKTLKERITPQSAKDPELNKAALSASGPLPPTKDLSQRSVGRGRKFLQTTKADEAPKSDEREVNIELQSSVHSSAETSSKVDQNELKIADNANLQEKTFRKRKRRRQMTSLRPAKMMRSNTTPSADKSDIQNKDCSNDGEPCLADNTTTAHTETPITAASTEISNLPTALEVTSKVITPKVSSKTISSNVPTIATSPTIPNDAASPTAPTGASNVETASIRDSVDSNVSETFPTSRSPSSSKKRGRPFSRKTLRREALVRRLELIRASTSQRLPCPDIEQSPAETIPDPVSVKGSTQLAEDHIPTGFEDTSYPAQPSVPVIASETAPHLPSLHTEAKSVESVQDSDPHEELLSSAISQPQDVVHPTTDNLVQPKVESADSLNAGYPASGLAPDMYESTPTTYSFAKPADSCLPTSELLLDTCHIDTNSFGTEPNENTKSMAIYDLPSYIVMRTRIITRSDLQNNKAAVPLQVKETVSKLAETVATSVVKEEVPNFKDICLEINSLLGKNANYLKFASGSERQARMNQVLSDSSLSAQEAQSALKFLQSYLAVRAKEKAVVNKTKGQQFIPIYDSQKKVIGYRKRRVEPKNSSHAQSTRRGSKSVNRTSNPPSLRMTSTTTANESLTFQQTTIEFTTKEEPVTLEGGDEELIVPDTTLANTSPIKSEVES